MKDHRMNLLISVVVSRLCACHRRSARLAGLVGVASLACVFAARADGVDHFASFVVEYRPAPGQFVNSVQFGDPSRALGPPTGGGVISPDNTGVVSLGAFGGSITLGFATPVMDHPRNPFGIDAIVYGNASFVAGDPQRRFAEAGVIEIAQDLTGNGQPDGPWYLIPGSHLAAGSAIGRDAMLWDAVDPLLPPTNASWFPTGESSPMMTWAYSLPSVVFGVSVLVNPNLGGGDPTVQGVFGYADCSPTLRLGDLTGDDVVDDFVITPEEFYTSPSDPRRVGVSPGSGGGDGFDIAWAIDPATGEPAGIDSFSFIRITTGVPYGTPGLFGEISTEIDAVARVRAVVPGADWDGDGIVTIGDYFAFLTDFFGSNADVDGDGLTTIGDYFSFLTQFFAAL